MLRHRIAISGASGLVGSALIDMLSVEQFELIRLQRPGSQGPSSGTSAMSRLDWEPREGMLRPHELEGIDSIVHLAGRPINVARWTKSEKIRLRNSRVQATQKLVQQISRLQHKPRLFLSASAIGYYGNCGDQWVFESHPACNDFLGQLTADWEAASLPLIQPGVRVIHARLGVVLSTASGALAKILPLLRSGLGGRLGSGNQYWSWIGLEDVCRALMFLLDSSDANGAYNLVSPFPVTNREFTQTLSQILRRPAIMPAPAWALRLATGEMADALLLSSCRASSARLEQAGFAFHHPQLRPFLESLLL